MVIDILTKKGWVTLDATRMTEAIGRLMNHAPSSQATARPFKALILGGQWRLGFVAAQDLQPGEELVWDYGVQPEGQQWLY